LKREYVPVIREEEEEKNAAIMAAKGTGGTRAP
jgi:hypothetical protein